MIDMCWGEMFQSWPLLLHVELPVIETPRSPRTLRKAELQDLYHQQQTGVRDETKASRRTLRQPDSIRHRRPRHEYHHRINS